MPGSLHMRCFSVSLTVALWDKLLSSLMSNWNLGEVRAAKDSHWPGWLPGPHTRLCPLWPPINYICTELTSQAGRDLPRELKVVLAVTLPHHWFPGPIRPTWWPGVFFLPHLCVRQALSFWLRPWGWPSLIKKDAFVVGPGGQDWELSVTPKCLPKHWDECYGKRLAGSLSTGHVALLQPHPGTFWGVLGWILLACSFSVTFFFF